MSFIVHDMLQPDQKGIALTDGAHLDILGCAGLQYKWL